MKYLLVAGLWMGPPVEATGESVLYESETTKEVEIVEPAPEPNEPTVLAEPTRYPELPPTLPPTLDSLLPVAAPRKVTLRPPAPPPSGVGRITASALLSGVTAGVALALVVEMSVENGNPRYAVATLLPIGVASAGVTLYLVISGAKAYHNYDGWQVETGIEPPPTGNGLIVGGSMIAAGGGAALAAAAVQASRQPHELDRTLTTGLYALGAVGVAGGLGMLLCGLVRRGDYVDWRDGVFYSNLTPTLMPVLDPSGAFALRGASFGVQGRL